MTCVSVRLDGLSSDGHSIVWMVDRTPFPVYLVLFLRVPWRETRQMASRHMYFYIYVHIHITLKRMNAYMRAFATCCSMLCLFYYAHDFAQMTHVPHMRRSHLIRNLEVLVPAGGLRCYLRAKILEKYGLQFLLGPAGGKNLENN